MTPFTQPMTPWPALATYSRDIILPDGLRLFYYDAGPADAPPVLLLHGLGDDADTWRHLLPRLAASHRVIAPDWPGFGRSDRPQRDYGIVFYRDTAVALLQALNLTHVLVVGHSLGAMTAQYWALTRPELLRGVVAIGGSLVVQEQARSLRMVGFIIPGLGEWLYRRLRRSPEAAFETLRPYYHHLDSLPTAERDWLFTRVNQRVWHDGQMRAYFSLLRGMVRFAIANSRDFTTRLPALSRPLHIIWGENDAVVPASNGRYLADLIPHARLTLIPQAGHNVMQEQPQAVANAIQTFFN